VNQVPSLAGLFHTLKQLKITLSKVERSEGKSVNGLEQMDKVLVYLIIITLRIKCKTDVTAN